jgi:hypothetical protein
MLRARRSDRIDRAAAARRARRRIRARCARACRKALRDGHFFDRRKNRAAIASARADPRAQRPDVAAMRVANVRAAPGCVHASLSGFGFFCIVL